MHYREYRLMYYYCFKVVLYRNELKPIRETWNMTLFIIYLKEFSSITLCLYWGIGNISPLDSRTTAKGEIFLLALLVKEPNLV